MFKYRVMEYLDGNCECPIGYACLTQKEFRKWESHPHEKEVRAFCVVEGMESLAEWGKVSCKRLWDYEAATDNLPDNMGYDKWYSSLAQDTDEFGEIIDEETAINQEAWNNLCGIFGEEEMGEILEDYEPEKKER